MVAGLAWLLPATAARAQFPYGYDSYYSYPNSATFWYQPGVSAVYTDPSTGAFHYGEYVSGRTIAPYSQPPYGAFQQGSGLPYVAGRSTVAAAGAAAAPVRKPVLTRRRAVILKRK